MPIAPALTLANEATENLVLTPSQQFTYDQIVSLSGFVPVLWFDGGNGLGRTTMMRCLQQELGAHYLGLTELMDKVATQAHPSALEETARELLHDAFQTHDLAIFDDFDIFSFPTMMANAYPRPFFLDVVLREIYDMLRTSGKRLIVVRRFDHSYDSIALTAVKISMPAFTAQDYKAILDHYLGADATVSLDMDKVYRFSSKLTGHQLRNAALLLQEKASSGALATETVLACIGERILQSNLHVESVESLTFADLKGAQALLKKLEVHVLLPMRDPAKAKQLGLKPKRGVLLHGYPGTGKTSVGRALAKMMKGKFFMIDGSFITEPPAKFFKDVKEIFEAARSNSPAVIFIDDADVLFKTDHVYGFNRYLLTMLDGLESESAGGDVCVMMTAMDVKDMPPALLRSGRVELWLETKLPGANTRLEILQHHTKDLLPAAALDDWDFTAITDGFTPADLRRIVSDAKALLMYDEEHRIETAVFPQYLMTSAIELRELKVTVAAALGYELPKSSGSDDIINVCG